MDGIGEIFGGLARGATAGMQLDQNQQRIDLASIAEQRQQEIQREQLNLTRETLKIKKDEAALQIKDMQLLGATAQAIQTNVEADGEVNKFIETGKGLGGVDSSMRGPLVDQYAAGFKQQYGVDLAPVVIATMKKAKPDALQGMFAALEEQIAQDPDMTPERLTKVLSDPLEAANAIVALTGAAKQLRERASVQSPDMITGELMKKRATKQRSIVEQQISRIDQVLPHISTKAGLDKILSLKSSLTTQLNNLDTQLRQDSTETLDLGDRIEIRDKASGQVIETRQKSPAPTQPANAQLMTAVNTKTGEVFGENVVFDPRTRRLQTVSGNPVPEGFVTVRGSATGSPNQFLGARATNEAETSVIGIDDQLANLRAIEGKLQDKFLQAPAKVLNQVFSGAESLGIDLTPDQKESLTAISDFQQESFKALNEGIRALTGAAMTAAETPRLRKQLPDPEKDSPTVFKTKLKSSIRSLELARARRLWMLANGIEFEFSGDKQPPVSLDGFKSMVDKRGDELMQELKDDDSAIGEDELKQQVITRLRQEFPGAL